MQSERDRERYEHSTQAGGIRSDRIPQRVPSLSRNHRKNQRHNFGCANECPEFEAIEQRRCSHKSCQKEGAGTPPVRNRPQERGETQECEDGPVENKPLSQREVERNRNRRKEWAARNR